MSFLKEKYNLVSLMLIQVRTLECLFTLLEFLVDKVYER